MKISVLGMFWKNASVSDSALYLDYPLTIPSKEVNILSMKWIVCIRNALLNLAGKCWRLMDKLFRRIEMLDKSVYQRLYYHREVKRSQEVNKWRKGFKAFF